MNLWLIPPVAPLVVTLAGRFVRSCWRMLRLARDLGLGLRDAGIAGRIDGVGVRIRWWKRLLVIELERSKALSPRFAIDFVEEPRRRADRIVRPGSPAARRAEAGDARSSQWRALEHDHEAVWSGADAGALDALLTGPVLAALAVATGKGKVRVNGGQVLGYVAEGSSASSIRRLVAALAALRAELESSAAGVPDRLLALTASGECVPLRRRYLEALQHRFGHRPETREASRAATLSPSPEIRLTGAKFVGAEGLPHLAALAGDRTLPADVRLEALGALASSSPEATRTVLATILAQPGCPSPLLRAAVGAATDLEHRAVAPLVAALAAREPALGACIARALERLGDPSCEAALLPLLEVEDEQVKLAAARALAVHGGLAAVEPLLHVARAGIGPWDDIWTAARSIQSRLARDAPGGVSIAVPGPEHGAISIPAPAEGGVSLVEAPRAAGPEPPAPSAS